MLDAKQCRNTACRSTLALMMVLVLFLGTNSESQPVDIPVPESCLTVLASQGQNATTSEYYLRANASTVHWGYFL